MRLLSAHIQNFKLLENVEIRFSTSREKPLTVIRAENGSGKTSLLHALTWGFYGYPGLPADAQDLGLISKATAPGRVVDVQVAIEFEHTDDLGDCHRYRLVRTATETAAADAKFVKGGTKVKLRRLTPSGDEEIPVEYVDKLLPLRLQAVFFTDGDRVQTFITQSKGADQLNKQADRAIRALLGLDGLETAERDLDAVATKLRREANKTGGPTVVAANDRVEQARDALAALEGENNDLLAGLDNMRTTRQQWVTELNELKGIGDLEELNAEIRALEADLERLNADELVILRELRGLYKSEAFSWALIQPKLTAGLAALGKLADANVIPGFSVSVLQDRLDLQSCICGEALDPADPAGAARRKEIQALVDKYSAPAEESQRLTETYHVARKVQTDQAAREASGETYKVRATEVLQRYFALRDSRKAKTAKYEAKKEQRGDIDDARVKDLDQKIKGVEAKISATDRKQAVLHERLEAARTEFADANAALEEANKIVNRTDVATRRWEVAQDLHDLAKRTLANLKLTYVDRVSRRMESIFMTVVGSDPGFEAAVFTGVRITPELDILVETQHGRRLDPSFELNGASQRALTLAFIWALMDVAGATAPRIIDTPLGMVAGGVKTRMVDAITAPSGDGRPDFQVVLLLTRSEIRDIEELIDARAGALNTLSCSKDYPEDLRFNWSNGYPLVRACECTHRQSCDICARTYDAAHGVEYRGKVGANS